MSDVPKASTSSQVVVSPLAEGSPWVAEIAHEQFGFWGELTGHSRVEAYETALRSTAASADSLPRVLVASRDGALLGSVNVMRFEMTIRPRSCPGWGSSSSPKPVAARVSASGAQSCAMRCGRR